MQGRLWEDGSVTLARPQSIVDWEIQWHALQVIPVLSALCILWSVLKVPIAWPHRPPPLLALLVLIPLELELPALLDACPAAMDTMPRLLVRLPVPPVRSIPTPQSTTQTWSRSACVILGTLCQAVCVSSATLEPIPQEELSPHALSAPSIAIPLLLDLPSSTNVSAPPAILEKSPRPTVWAASSVW